MVTLPGYWTTDAFTDPLGLLGWVKGPTQKAWEPTTRFQQVLSFSGPTAQFNDFITILCGNFQLKPFQMTVSPEGPNSNVRIVYYSDDADGLYPRDPILETYSLLTNVGTESLLWTKKTVMAFMECPDIVRRIQVAVQMFQDSVSPASTNYWAATSLPTSADLTQLMNALFEDCVVKGLRYVDGTAVDPITAGCMLWRAQQLYRSLLKGVTTCDRVEFVIRKVSTVFPRNLFNGQMIGSDLRSSYYRCQYMFSYQALLESEPNLNSDTQALLNYAQLPRFWWWKMPPNVEQTNDGRWMVAQEFRGFEVFETYVHPWVMAKGETIPSGRFDPSTFYDSPSGYRDGDGKYVEMPPTKQYAPSGVKPVSGCYQWPKSMQEAIWGNQGDMEDM